MTKSPLTVTVAAAFLIGLTVSTAQAQQPAPAQPAPPTTTTTTTTKTVQTTATSGPETTTNPTYELSVAYQWLTTGAFCLDYELDEGTCTDDDAKNFPAGIAVDAVRNWGGLGLVGEAGWSHYGEDDIAGPGSRRTDNIFHIGAGLRFTWRPGRVWPYVQGLGGATFTLFDVNLVTSQFEETRTRPFVQGGGGVTFVTGDGWGLFVAGDYRRVFLDEDEDFDTGRNDIRGLFGIRMILD